MNMGFLFKAFRSLPWKQLAQYAPNIVDATGHLKKIVNQKVQAKATGDILRTIETKTENVQDRLDRAEDMLKQQANEIEDLSKAKRNLASCLDILSSRFWLIFALCAASIILNFALIAKLFWMR